MSPRPATATGRRAGGPAPACPAAVPRRSSPRWAWFPPAGGEAFLASVHPGHTADQVRAETGWELKLAPDLSETVPPTDAELAQIRRFDPDGFWTRPASR